MTMQMKQDKRVFVAGHRGLVGSAVYDALERKSYEQIITRAHRELDLQDAVAVERFFSEEKPEFVILAAARVGGIMANNTYPADFIRDNILIQTNVIDACHRHGVERLLFLGSSCIYPKLCPQPIREEYLLTGPLEPTNQPYALAKIAGVEMCWAYNRQFGTQFLAAMPTNLYGPRDSFDLQNSHVLPALLRKIEEAKRKGDASVMLWGSGTPRREFLYADDMADACVFLMELGDNLYRSLLTSDAPPLINIGLGEDISIRDLAAMICEIVGYDGQLQFDISKPDGTPRKLLDGSKMAALGWRAKTSLPDGIRRTLEAARSAW